MWVEDEIGMGEEGDGMERWYDGMIINGEYGS